MSISKVLLVHHLIRYVSVPTNVTQPTELKVFLLDSGRQSGRLIGAVEPYRQTVE